MRKILLLSTVSLSLLFTSCYSSRVYHGNMTENTPQVKVVSKNNPILLWGLLPLSGSRQQAKDVVGNRTDYTTKTSWTFINGLLNFITIGIYTPTTTTYYLPLENGYYQNRNNQQYQRGYSPNVTTGQGQQDYYPNPPIQQYQEQYSPDVQTQQQYQNGYNQSTPVPQYKQQPQYQVPPVPQNQQKQYQNPPARPSNRSNSQYY